MSITCMNCEIPAGRFTNIVSGVKRGKKNRSYVIIFIIIIILLPVVLIRKVGQKIYFTCG